TDRYNLYAVRPGASGRQYNGRGDMSRSLTAPPHTGYLESPPADSAAIDGAAPTPLAEQLRRYLRQHLPEYMVPSAVVLLDRLPLTHHGKVDRNALPPPDSDAVRTSEQSAGALPQTPHEEIVAGVWAEVIGIAVVRREDNFFDLGG